MADTSIQLVETYEGSVELSSDGYAFATVEVEFSNIPASGLAIEAQILLYKEETILSASDPSCDEISTDSPSIWLSDSFFCGSGQIPDSYSVCFRVFKPDEGVSIETPIPPEIARQSGSFLIHTPKKGFLSKEKWNSGQITVESVVVKNAAGEEDELFINLFSKKPLESGFKVEAESAKSADTSIFKMCDKPHMSSDYLHLHLEKNLNVKVTGFNASGWTVSDKKTFSDVKSVDEPLYDAGEPEQADIQPEPQVASKPASEKIPKVNKKGDKAETATNSWFDVKTTSKDDLSEEFEMAITQFETDGPDDDGDISVDLTLEIQNESNKDISLIKWDLIVDHDGTTIDGNLSNSEECLLDKGDTFEASSWLRINKSVINKSNPELKLRGYAKFYEREFYKLGEIEIPETVNDLKVLQTKIKSEFFENDITISLVRRPDGGEANAKEHEVYLKASIANNSGDYVEDIEFKGVLIDRTGSEEDETTDFCSVLAPHSGTLLQPVFWARPKSKLKGAKVEFLLKAYRLVGTKVFSEVKALSV